MFAAVAHGMPLDCLALKAKGAYISGLMRIRLTQKGAYTLVLCADFCSCWQEIPLHCLGLMASYVNGCYRTLYTYTVLKAVFLYFLGF